MYSSGSSDLQFQLLHPCLPCSTSLESEVQDSEMPGMCTCTTHSLFQGPADPPQPPCYSIYPPAQCQNDYASLQLELHCFRSLWGSVFLLDSDDMFVW